MNWDDNLTVERPNFVTHLECSLTGERYEDQLSERLFEPLGLEDTVTTGVVSAFRAGGDDGTRAQHGVVGGGARTAPPRCRAPRPAG